MFKGFKIAGAVFIAATALYSATITLQQGTNGFTGCSDTHIQSTWDSDFPGWKGDYSAATELGAAGSNYYWLGSSW